MEPSEIHNTQIPGGWTKLSLTCMCICVPCAWL